MLIADRAAGPRASICCLPRCRPSRRRQRSNDTRPLGGAEDRGQGVVVVRKLEKSMAGRRQLIETMSHREPRGVCLHWAVSKNPNSLPLSLPLFFFPFPGSRAVVQRRNHGGWDWGQAVCGSTRRLGLSHTPESQPVLSCLGPYRQSKPGRTQLTSVLLFELLAQREFPS